MLSKKNKDATASALNSKKLPRFLNQASPPAVYKLSNQFLNLGKAGIDLYLADSSFRRDLHD